MFREVLSRYAPGVSMIQQISRRLFSAEANLQHYSDAGSHPSSDKPNEHIIPTANRRNINRVYLSGTVTAKPFFGTSKNGNKFGVVRITSNSFSGQYDFRVRLETRTSLAYCKENVNEATFPRAAADGTQGSMGTVMATRISVESSSVPDSINENEQLEDVDLPAEEDLEQNETNK